MDDRAHYELRWPHRGPFDITYHVIEDVTIHDDVPDQFESFSCSAKFTILARIKISREGERREFEFNTGEVFLSTKDVNPYYVIRYTKPSGKVVTTKAYWSGMTFGRALGLGVVEYFNCVADYMERRAYKDFASAPRSDRQ